ncbi:MAG: hypothetical protein RR846_08750 [Oscillospiraceae bacterium]
MALCQRLGSAPKKLLGSPFSGGCGKGASKRIARLEKVKNSVLK